MKKIENYSDWSGQWEEYRLFGVTPEGQNIDLTEEFVGDIVVHNSGETTERKTAKLLCEIDSKRFKSAYYIHCSPCAYDEGEVIETKIRVF
jgi:hypothetical protein